MSSYSFAGIAGVIFIVLFYGILHDIRRGGVCESKGGVYVRAVCYDKRAIIKLD